MSDSQERLNNAFQKTSLHDGELKSGSGYDANSASTFIPGQSYGGYQAPDYGQYNQYQGFNQGYNQYQGYQNQYQNQYQGYQNQYQNQYQGYQAPNQGYQGYNPQQYQAYNPNQAYNPSQQQPQAKGMSLADFQKQQGVGQQAKPKKTLKLAGSSGIKLANANKQAEKEEPKKEEPKKEEPKEQPKEEPKEEPKEQPKEQPKEPKEQPKEQPQQKEESKSATPTPKEGTPEPSKTQSKTKSKHSNEVKAQTSQQASTVEALAKQQEEEVDEEVVKDMFGGKDHVSIMFMGHVDAGKSTMGGNILYLTDSVDKRTVEKYEREAKDAGKQGWYLSWIMDTNKEERSDGKTIEVGRAYFETEKRRYTILDAPGHKMYVSEMIGGASQADVGVLVISARKGEYETGFEKGGQTREHALLAKTQGVNNLIVVVNKMDDPTVNWSEDRYKECTNKLLVFLKGIGFNKDDILCMPVSGFTGSGLKDRVKKDCSWYDGPSLLEALDNVKPVDRKINGPFMLPVSAKMKDMGLIVEGKIESGRVKKNQPLLLMPSKVKIEVGVIYNETEQECDQAFSGEQVRLKVKGVEEEEVNPGFVLCSVDRPVKTVWRFAAQIAIVELKSILSNGFSCVMHLHTAIEEVKFVELKHKLEKGTNRKSKKPPAFAKKGMKIIAILEASAPVCAETYGDYPQLGRFTLRDQGVTIAIGKITKLLE